MKSQHYGVGHYFFAMITKSKHSKMFLFLEGRRHDSGILADSQLLPLLNRHALLPRGQLMCIYGDPAYPLRAHLILPFRDRVLNPQMQAFNTSMSKVREAVEWLFNDVATPWKFIDFKKNLRIGLCSVGEMYFVCSILRNALTCLYGNMTSEYFDLDPPDLQNYFI